ncbi:hypothetical protein COU05_00095 [bacterium (Candidatus Gribaldobacteria) CG10_big_fil_rev_8_21_14_0_10_37_21]|uniref:Transcriptional repressor PaaX-like central Cas2-like domain-containing protein n=1 Tax=bacterium (Candidatus Gribaldobacteria) CG10_big_fil_rev_8_21_14_0_10_37_21 TaxID=2014275 RepID=A0A2H0UV89_9BACT|nr:MAG: hypothetical protein AUJ25_00865 [Parcubacteria group bacterium CG1_02_37_13]PIR90776.1 MAG: hypothetical protein COU05_00095 [bacterium (Candidatus Gribaldobacteria) CG10_big_fil_rev_8_21_14_0_10_37_21]
MANNQYFFQKKSRRRMCRGFFEKGLNLSSAVLFYLGDALETFGEALPAHDSRFRLMKWMLTDGKESNKPKDDKYTEDIKKRIRLLERQGLIFKDVNKKIFALTKKGQEAFDFIAERYKGLNQKWDGKLRIIIFDIPEKKKSWRVEIRRELSLMQYVLLQKSVYIGKYPLAGSFLKELYNAGVSKNIFIFTVGQMDRQEEIMQHFQNDRFENVAKEKN